MRNITHLPCNGCIECCRWGHHPEQFRPDKSLGWTPEGDCVHLDVEKKRCKIWGKKRRPKACAEFDCRMILLIEHPFVRITSAAHALEERLQNREKGQN